MNKKLHIYAYFVFLFICSNSVYAKNIPGNAVQELYFIENKGQIKDQYGNSRNDIQYALQAPGITVFVGNGQLQYVFSHQEECTAPHGYLKDFANKKPAAINSQSPKIETYRMDVTLEGANGHVKIINEDSQAYYENYYLLGCLKNGIHAHTFKKVTYKNVYPGIDWVLSVKRGMLEQEFMVSANADVSKIKIKYNGQNALKINEDGGISASTPMGVIKEKAPICYSNRGKNIQSAFTLKNNILSYDLNEYKGALVIDPVVEWGTYYSVVSDDACFYDIACDAAANIYACGLTYCAIPGIIATTGSYQDSYGGGRDAFLVKFDSSGHRLWATYYGGSGTDVGLGVTCDHSGNIYLAGNTSSSDSIATPGCQQYVYGGGMNNFLAKFDIAGFRQWATYIGGDQVCVLGSVSCDLYGHVYVSGVTEDTFNIATAGSFQPTQAGNRDCFLIQYDSTGRRHWGTYYGGTDDDLGGVNCNDGLNVYLNGWTFSKSQIASVLSYQSVLAGSSDAFLVKFDSSGNRIWGTYYGGKGQEITGALAYSNQSVYLFGTTQSDLDIASAGAYQTARAGMQDAFLAQFDTSGSRRWGTYYGGPGNETADQSRITADDSANVYVIGYTTSTSGIASAGAWKATYSSTVNNGFLAKFNNKGSCEWSTYYGGTGEDEVFACTYDGKGIYICGQTNSSDSIATPGGFLPTGGGPFTSDQGFLVKFEDIDTGALYLETKQISSSNISISPIPNSGSFTLDGTFENSNGIVQITISDMAGNTIKEYSAVINNGMIHEHIHLDASLSSGTYVLKAVSKDKVNVLKFEKE